MQPLLAVLGIGGNLEIACREESRGKIGTGCSEATMPNGYFIFILEQNTDNRSSQAKKAIDPTGDKKPSTRFSVQDISVHLV